MTQTVTFHGSHGSLTACAVSGHVIHADSCECEDCQRFGDYRSIALVAVGDSDPVSVAAGGGDILGASLVYRDGGFCRALAWLDDDDGGGYYDELPALPAPESI